jgi:uncharacterized protein YfaS (alpha-2-macroglobulin family)
LIGVYAGTSVRLTGTFRNISGTLTSPTTVTLTIQPPDGAADLTYTPTLSSTGIYYYDLDTTSKVEGLYRYRFGGVGVLIAASEDVFEVLPSRVV